MRRFWEILASLPLFRGVGPPGVISPGPMPDHWLRRETFDMAGRRVPKWLCEFDTILSGGKGTGKTTVMRAMMESLLLSEIEAALAAGARRLDWRRLNWNAFAYTPKNDDFYWPLRARLEPLGIPVRSTNPFRKGSWAWAPWKGDLKSFAALEQAVRSFVKEDPKETNRYFRDAARLVVRGVLLSLSLTHPRRITFRRVVKILQSRYLLRQVLARTSHTRALLALLDESSQGTAAGNVFTTILAVIKDLEILAAEVDETPEERQYALADIANEPGVWVWESDPRYEAVMELWNGLQEDFLTPHLLVRGNIGFTTYRFIDEYPQLNGRVKSTNSQKLSEWGRTSRVRNVYAIQTYAQLVELFGREAADSHLGQCHNFVIFKHSDLEGRRYWSERIGKLRGMEEKHSYQKQRGWSENYGRDGSSQVNGSTGHTVAHERYERDRVPPGAIGDLPIGSIHHGVFGYAGIPISPRMNPETGAPDSLLWNFHLSPEWMRAHTPRHPDFKPYKDCMKPPKQFLPELDDTECAELGLEPDPDQPKA